MPRPLSARLLPLAAAGLIGWSGAALAQTSTTPQTMPRQGGPESQQTLQNNSATRALDRAAGTNTSGAYPQQSDGTPANPPGTAATRALDRAAGTNTSGAYPQQSDGTPANPPGTAMEREMNRPSETSPSNPAPDRRSEVAPRILLAQNPLGPRPGEGGAKLSGPEAQSGVGSNSGGSSAAPATPVPGNAATRPEGNGRQISPGSPSGNVTEAPSLETREVRPPTSNPSPQDRPDSAR